jgi:MFS family permease
LGQAGLIFSVPVFMQAVRGADAFHTGLVMLPMSLTALFIAPLAGAFVHRISPKIVVVIGLISSTIGYTLLATTLTVNSTSANFVLPFIFMGLGMGATMSSISNLTLSAVSPEQSGEASGVNNTLRQLGGTLGTAVIGAVLISTISANLISGIQGSNVIPPIAKPFISDAVSKQTSAVEFSGGAKIATNVPQAVKDEIINISHVAITDANKQALGYTAMLSALALLVSFWIPGGKNIEIEQDLSIKPSKKKA